MNLPADWGQGSDVWAGTEGTMSESLSLHGTQSLPGISILGSSSHFLGILGFWPQLQTRLCNHQDWRWNLVYQGHGEKWRPGESQPECEIEVHTEVVEENQLAERTSRDPGLTKSASRIQKSASAYRKSFWTEGKLLLQIILYTQGISLSLRGAQTRVVFLFNETKR